MKKVLTFNHWISMGNKTLKYLIVVLLLCLVMVTAVAATDNGELDPTFGSNGIVATDHGALFDDYGDIALQPDRKIVTVGTAATSGEPFMTTVARYMEDGSLDVSFGVNGIRNITFGDFGSDGGAVGLQSDGKIIVAGASVGGTGKYPSKSFSVI